MADVVLQLDPGDNVAIALADLPAGQPITAAESVPVTATADIPRGHKIAIRPIDAGRPVIKYGQPIGQAMAGIAPGDHVHGHNLEMIEVDRDYEFATARFTPQPPPGDRPTFLGYRRADGRVGSRNYIGVLTSVNCSSTAARLIADQFRGAVLDDHPGVDGVMALTHGGGCGLINGSEGAEVLLRTLRGYAAHPNFAGLLILGLGCEMMELDLITADLQLSSDLVVDRMTIQETGGFRASVAEGTRRIKEMLPIIDRCERTPVDAGELILGLECGGSDGYSGITANPALGVASDFLVGLGGTAVLAETPEIFGAEHLLTRRAVSAEVGRRLLDRIDWWREYVAAGGGTLDNNPSPGNKRGGLTTILEKSLGAVAKGGQAELSAVYEYAEPITTRGFGFMDTPGYDPVSVTGLVAGGANIVCFTTGRGSVFGCKPVPSIKIGTNSELARSMPEDIDINAGTIVDGTESVTEVGQRIFETILAVASGTRTASEEFDIGQDEFVPWQLGAVT